MSTALQHLLEHSAKAFPQNIAIEEPSGKQISYSQLNELADSFCQKMKNYGVKQGDRIGIYAPKSIETVAAIFGALKSGAAYVPVDVNSPAKRNQYILNNCQVCQVVTSKQIAEKLMVSASKEWKTFETFSNDFVLLGNTKKSKANQQSTINNQQSTIAYILYTSGSTGKPKGVMYSHYAALSFVDWCSKTFEPTGKDVFSSHAPFHFDLSILDLYVSVKHGAKLALIDENLGKHPLALAPFIAEKKITHWYSTPSILRLLVQYGKLDDHDFSNLKTVLFAGEVFPIKHLRELKSKWTTPRYFNLYGPTETNVCMWHEIPEHVPRDKTEPFPIGKPCDHFKATVIDNEGNRCNPGEEGELLIAGPFMDGYWGNEELTKEVFFEDENTKRWYKTGDLVKELKDGSYQFLGRKDRMVKRRGFRVELGEIEAALYTHPAMTEVAVIAVPDEENGVLVKAFLCLSDKGFASLVKMKMYCSEKLPNYMVPDTFSFHDELPKTSTDKIDYQSLR